MVDGVRPTGMSARPSPQAAEVSCAPTANSMSDCTRPVIAPEQSASRFAPRRDTQVVAQFAAATERLAAMLAMEATICSMLMAQILADLSVAPGSSAEVHVLAASLIPVASAANWVVACKVSKVQDATEACSAGVFTRFRRSSRSAATTNFSKSSRLPCHFSAARPSTRSTNTFADVRFSARSNLRIAWVAACRESRVPAALAMAAAFEAESQRAIASGSAPACNSRPPSTSAKPSTDRPPGGTIHRHEVSALRHATQATPKAPAATRARRPYVARGPRGRAPVAWALVGRRLSNSEAGASSSDSSPMWA
mmetsp:Transcript_37957/g.109182  ORF Transcript_37957/g.109182 Transcript_37957/m.109182 type:complete len:310 (+) Transcript_37957:726-1655(+)